MESEGTVYLIHIWPPIAHAGHYLGHAMDLETRLLEHWSSMWIPYETPIITSNGGIISGYQIGNGARLLAVANHHFCNWHVVRTWQGSLELEKLIKRSKRSRALCPVCSGETAYSRGLYRTH